MLIAVMNEYSYRHAKEMSSNVAICQNENHTRFFWIFIKDIIRFTIQNEFVIVYFKLQLISDLDYQIILIS